MTDESPSQVRDAHLTVDQVRLAQVAKILVGIGEINFEALAWSLAKTFGHVRPGARDYYHAVCIGLDTCVKLDDPERGDPDDPGANMT